MEEPKDFTITHTSDDEFKQETNIDVYTIAVGDTTFVDLFNKPENMALVWNGILDITKIQEIALDEISEKFFGKEHKIDSSNTETLDNVMAFLIYTHVGNQAEIGEYHLDNFAEFEKYKEIIANTSWINFARFDVSRTPMEYSITTTTEVEGRPEAAIRFENKSFFAPVVLQWILDHHNERENLIAQGMDEENIRRIAKAVADIVL